MTRDDAKRKLFDIIECGMLNFSEKGLIDTIYDNFESRTCNTCKHCEPLKDSNHCLLNIKQVGYEVELDFCCNKWEQKCT